MRAPPPPPHTHVRGGLMTNRCWDAALLCVSVPPTAPGVSCQMRCTPERTLTGSALIPAQVRVELPAGVVTRVWFCFQVPGECFSARSHSGIAAAFRRAHQAEEACETDCCWAVQAGCHDASPVFSLLTPVQRRHRADRKAGDAQLE